MRSIVNIITVLALIVIVGCSNEISNDENLTKDDLKSAKYSKIINSHLDSRSQQLELLFHNSDIIRYLDESNNILQSQEKITAEDYQKIDTKMQSDKQASDVQRLMYNKCALRLRGFLSKHHSFKEISITNLDGINICQTDLNSDFYQADEKWWQDAYNDGFGKKTYGKVMYKEDASSIDIPIYLPIYTAGKLIGISKSVVSIDDVDRSDIKFTNH